MFENLFWVVEKLMNLVSMPGLAPLQTAMRGNSDLNLFGGQICSFPDSFFHKEKIVTLKLSNVVVEVPPLVCFPNLKSIVLFSVKFPDDDSMKNLILGSPVLWSLKIYWCQPYDVLALYICSSTLYKLDLCVAYSAKDFRFQFVIDTPNLSHLNVNDSSGSTYEVSNVTSLVTASLGVYVEDRMSMEVLTKGVHLEELHLLSDQWGRFTDTSLPNLPIFHNLVRFTVEVCYGTGWNALPTLFHCMPKLVTFIIDMGGFDEPCAWCDPNEVPRCFLYCIENVEILNLIQGGQEIQMISYILQNAMVLKNLSIRGFSRELEEENEFLKTLLTLPRSAVGCRVECGLELEVEM